MVSFASAKDKLLFSLLSIIALGSVSFCTWLTTSIMSRPTRTEVESKIASARKAAIDKIPTWSQIDDRIGSKAPYVEDRKLVMEAVRLRKESDAHMKLVVEQNTKALNDLRVSMAKIEAALKLKE